MDSGSTTNSPSYYDFLDRMRKPASKDLVRSTKSFIVSFSFSPANPETDGKKLQDFLLDMEATIREHPSWLGASEEEIDSSIEGLEKYVMTKLYNRTFAASPEGIKIDQEISEKIDMLKNFLRPEHLDIPEIFQNEASWLLAEKELKKMNAFQAPREKLLCILSCCRVINNLLLKVTMSEDRVPGADDFLPVLIYVVIKANPPQLHSNLEYIQLYRRQTKLTSESAYYFTNLVSAKSFILDLDAKSLSIDETEFQKSMQSARSALMDARKQMSSASNGSTIGDILISSDGRDPGPSRGKQILEALTDGGSHYPFMEAEAGELTVDDVETLLRIYKDVVSKYTSLRKAIRYYAVPKIDPSPDHSQEINIKLDQQLDEQTEKHNMVRVPQ